MLEEIKLWKRFDVILEFLAAIAGEELSIAGFSLSLLSFFS
jgi:hypothetical protein